MKYFGTDGIRGNYGIEPITIPIIQKIAWAFGQLLKQTHLNPTVLIGRDTRATGTIIQNAINSALKSAKIHVIDGGIAPTPAIACNTKWMHAQGAIAITASHNPSSDNGLKFFNYQGIKLSFEEEKYIESLIEKAPLSYENITTTPTINSCEKYVQKIIECIPQNHLKGFKIVLDTAHGAGTYSSEKVLKYAGVDIISIGNSPNGTNINDHVGSEYPEYLKQLVLENNANLGFAHDGDADRLVCIDETGKIIPGEIILGSLAVFMHEENNLRNNTLVTTIQSNYGLDQSLQKQGIKTIRTDVGDRNVLEELLNLNCNLGGEASGHFIFSDLSPCGDGLVTALELLKYLKSKKLLASDLFHYINLLPQKSININIQKKLPLSTLPTFYPVYQKILQVLQSSGRILARYSGTENKLRLLVEGTDEKALEEYLVELTKAATIDLN